MGKINDFEKLAYETGTNSNLIPINRNSFAGKKGIRKCNCCKVVKEISEKNIGLCSSCYKWCFNWVKKRYGYWDKKKLHEAISAFWEPLHCKYCGKELKGEKGKRRNRRKRLMCKNCEKIYLDAVQDASKPKRSGYRYRRVGDEKT